MNTQPQKSTRRSAEPVGTPVDQPEADSAERRSKIALAAYFIAERRGFSPGHELDDWLAAEAEIEGGDLPSVVTSIEISTKGKAS
jgi:Protein of unknown function (DUF2934).